MKKLGCILFVFFAMSASAQIQVSALRTELMLNPIGIANTNPRFSWELNSKERNVQQVAYEILVASSIEKLNANQADIWNSGKVNANQSIQIVFAGKKLISREQCYWKLKSYTNKGASNWSAMAQFSMGLLQSTDWTAKWIGYDKAAAWDSVTQFSRLSARYFRKQFQSNKAIKKAQIFVAGLGLYELFINGQKVGNQLLAPAPTDYRKTVLYNSFDVANYLHTGNNVVAMALGNGRYFTMRQNYKPQKINAFGFPKLLLQLEIEYTDGTKKTIESDASWRLNIDGPIRTANEHDFLTGMPNRAKLESALAHSISRARESNSLLSFVFIDIDYFKTVNDKYGHDVGDALLVNFVKRIRNSLPETSLVARIAGDEFAILIQDVKGEAHMRELMDEVFSAMKRPFTHESLELAITCSAGCALADGSQHPAEVVRVADKIMYQAKSEGRNRYLVTTVKSSI